MPSFSVLPEPEGFLLSGSRWSLNPNVVTVSVRVPVAAKLKGQSMHSFRLSVFACVALVPFTVRAQNPVPGVTNQFPPVVVTGTRIPSAPENTASPVTVIAREEIDRKQTRLVADVLRDAAGLDVARTGQPGALTTVFLRGANASHTLVLVDGIRVNNAFNNAFDFGNLSVDNIERIEVLRGPQSTLYGSEALGGVINIVTRRGAAAPTGSATVEYGSNNGLLTRGSFAAGPGKFSLSAEGSYASGDNERPNSDFSTLNFSGRAGCEFTEQLSASLLATYLKSDAGSPNDRFTDDPNDFLKNENTLVALTFEAAPVAWWNAKLTLSHAHERGVFYQPAPNPPFFLGDYRSQAVADRDQVDFQNVFTLGGHHKILAGGTCEQSPVTFTDTFSTFDRTVNNKAAYAQYEFAPVSRLTLTAGGRLDDFSSFGTHATYRFGARVTAPGTETILRANVGTGFRAPGISQLYFPFFGNPNLRPEESSGWDAGAEQPLWKSQVRVGATFFHNDFDNLISGFPPMNVSRARTLGLETFADWTPLTNLTARAGYTWLDARDRSTDLRLERRPEHRGSLNVNYDFCGRFSAHASALFVGSRPDSDFSAFPSTRVNLPGYEKLDLGLRCKISKNFSVYGRVENLLDERYEEVFGFPALGRTFWAGVQAAF